MSRWIGIDAGEGRHGMVLLGEDGEQVWSLSVLNRSEQIEASLAELVAEAGEQVTVMVESVRSVGFVVTEVALRMGLEVFSSGTHALEEFRDAEGQPRKDDERDAYLLARMGYLGFGVVRPVLEVREEEGTLGRLTRLRQRLGEDHTRLQNRFRSSLVELSPALLSSEAPKWSSRRVRSVMKRWPALIGLQRARLSSIERELVGARVAKRSAEAEFLKRAAGEVVMSEAVREVVALEIEGLIERLELLESAMKQLDERIESLISKHPQGQKLLEMPGIGAFVAAVIVAELLPLARHGTEAEMATYAGLTPLSRSSGKRSTSRLSRRTNKRVLRALYLSAIASTRVSAIDRAYYDKKRGDYEGHPVAHVKATLSLARQRQKVIYKLLTTEERYDKEVLISSHLERRAAA